MIPRMDRRPVMAAFSLLAACTSSPPVHFYTLDPVDASHPAADTSHGQIKVGAVHLPPALDRKQMVAQTAANTLTISDQNRWGAPLDAMLRRVLTQDLMQRLPQGQVILPESVAPGGTRVVELDVLRFQPEPGGSVVLDGSWSLSAADSDQPGSSHPFVLREPALQNDYAAQAQAMSKLVGRLADAIAAALASSTG